MVKISTLLLALCAAPLVSNAQSNMPPAYTFSGGFPGAIPGMSNMGGYSNNGQNPFMTMPVPQYYGNQQTVPRTVSPTVQPVPFWMQTPSAAWPPARFITQIPPSGTTGSNARPPAALPGYTQFAPSPAPQSRASRWAPLPGQAPVIIQIPMPTNNWSMAPAQQSGTNYAPAIANTPPRWPTQ